MPPDRRPNPEKDATPTRDYDAEPEWRSKPLTPGQVLVNDIRLESLRSDRGPMLEVNERLTSTLVPDSAAFTPAASRKRARDAAANPIEERRFINLEEQYGWIRELRLQDYQRDIRDSDESAKCRWIHCSSKFPEYLGGFLWALTDDVDIISDSMRLLDIAVQRNQRFSKHGKHFSPFVTYLDSQGDGSGYPVLISTPWLDWSVSGKTPPLRFQVDRREGYGSARSSSHMIRSILQYYFRLEDTADREKLQVFAKHKPWTTNREIDLKIRQWYGHYPSSLNVDELWILAVDAEHVVTFSSNQTWKSRWPPLQLTSRISDVAFRSVRNDFYRSRHDLQQEYTATVHVITCLAGAVGMMHRNFWPDLPLCLADRYAGHLGHLQLRLHRAPTTKLVMDLISCQEELNMVIQITQQQLEVIAQLQKLSGSAELLPDHGVDHQKSQRPPASANGFTLNDSPHHRATFRSMTASNLTDPLAQLQDNLQRELVDLQELRDNANTLVNRTIQLVNIRLEDHGKAILIFTVVTIIFLPLNFVSSVFGMNTIDIRDMTSTQSLFWAVAICVTTFVVGSAIFLAFKGGKLLDKLHLWLDDRRDRSVKTTSALRQNPASGEGFKVYGTDRVDNFRA